MLCIYMTQNTSYNLPLCFNDTYLQIDPLSYGQLHVATMARIIDNGIMQKMATYRLLFNTGLVSYIMSLALLACVS